MRAPEQPAVELVREMDELPRDNLVDERPRRLVEQPDPGALRGRYDEAGSEASHWQQAGLPPRSRRQKYKFLVGGR